MAHLTCCPEDLQWAALLRGQMSAEEAQALEQHLADCATCLQTVKGLRIEDTLEDALRSQSTSVEEVLPEPVQRLMDRLQKLRPAFQPRGEMPTGALSNEAPARPHPEEEMPDHTEEGFSFLAPAQGAGEIGRLGGYRVLKVLGQGGMGVVFQAEDVHLERLVALKAMKPSVAANKAAKQRFLREAKACAALKHDHVITIHQVSEDNGVPFIAMEFLQGMPLDEWLARGRKATVPQILRIGREVAKGLAAAHDKGLIHRDIKPGNIWLDKESGRVKILDFGLARTQTENVNITQSGAVVGTPAYMAPEQARAEPVDGRCDLFSLGCVLYRLCTGHVPFKGDTTMAVLMALALETPNPVHEINPAIPEALSALITKLLAKDAKDRPASAKEVIKAIQAIEGALSGGSSTKLAAPVAAPAASPAAANPFQDLTEASSKVVVPRKTVPAKKTPASGGRQPPEKASPASPRGADAPRSPTRRKPLVAAAVALVLGGAVLAGVVLIIKGKKGDTVLELTDGSTARIDGEKVTVTPPSSGPRPSVTPALPLPAGASPFDALRKENIPADVLAALGDVPAELVAVFGAKDKQRGSAITALNVSPDGQQIFITNPDGTWVRDTATGQLSAKAPKGFTQWPGLMALSRDGRRLAQAYAGNGGITVADAASWQELKKFGRLGGTYRFLAINHDGTRVASVLDLPRPAARTVQVWDATTGEELFKLDSHADDGVVFSPDGKWLATMSQDGAQLWDVQTGKEGRGFTVPRAGSRSLHLAFTPDGTGLAVPAIDYIHVLDVATGAERAKLRHPRGSGPKFTFRPDCLEAALLSDQGQHWKVTLFGTAKGEHLRELALPGPVTYLAYAPDGRHLLTGNQDGTVYILRLAEAPPTGSQLFNGKDLTGWDVLGGSWRFENGDLIYKPLKEDRAASDNLVSKRTFRDFELKFQVRLKGASGNPGVVIRGTVAAGNPAEVTGHKCAMGGRYWGGFGEVGQVKVAGGAATKTVKPDDFNDYSIRCVGKHVTIKVNGETTTDADFPDLPDEGLLGWHVLAKTRLEEVVFRNFEFTDLTTGPAPKAVSPPADPDRAVAAWALEYGGRVTLQVGGTVTTLVGKKGGVDLPAEPFRVLKLYFMYPEAIPVDKLAQLQSLPRLESLAFYLNNRWSGDFTPHLAALTNLKSLQVSGTKPQHLTTLEFLRNFANLEELILGSRSNFGDEALAPIADLKKLRILDLRHCPISDVGLVHLRDLPQLTELDLSLTKISDEGLRQLNPKLTNLGLRWTAITDAGLAQLAQRLPNLTHLQLVKTPITDAGLQHLGKLSKLTGLHLGETKVTAEGVKKLQADLPKCKVNTTETEPDPEPQPED